MRTALITGASDGIGKSIAIAMSALGYKLILFGRNNKRLQITQKACEDNGVAVTVYAFDITDSKKLNSTINSILKDQSIDILINNAGVWHKAGDLTLLSEETITQVIQTNLTSHILLTRLLLSSMRKRQQSAIINIVSQSGIVPQIGQSVYSASKYGMKGFTDVLRLDTAQDPIKVAGLYQSGTDTKLFAKAKESFSTESFTNPNDLAEVVIFMLNRPKRLWINEIHITK